MDRRRPQPSRPASSEEIECWSHAAASLAKLSTIYSKSTTADIIGRVNRGIHTWPVNDDIAPPEGYESVKTNAKKLNHGLRELQSAAEQEAKAIEDAIERIGVLIALRKASEALPPGNPPSFDRETLLKPPMKEKRNKRPRAPSPSPAIPVPAPPAPTPAPNIRNSVSITVPPRKNSVAPARGSSPAGPPIPFSREPKARREALARQLPLQEGRKVAFHPPAGKPTAGGAGDTTDENTWILAIITKCINADKNRYEVQDPEPQEDGQPGLCYNTTLRAIIPLPDLNAPVGNAAHLSAYQEFPAGSTVMALYPDTSCFYRAEVISTPKDMQPPGRVAPSSKYAATYKLKFEDDDNQEHSVPAQWVVEWPGS